MRFKPLMAGLAAIAAVSFASTAAAQTSTRSLAAFGLTSDNQLVSFRTGAPRLTTRVVGPISGLLAADTTIVGIDFRPSNGLLYAVGNGGGVYTVDTGNATATFVNQLNDAGMVLGLEGTRFGVDFNPAADRLRIVSDAGQNLRHNVNPGGVTLIDGDLNNGAAMPMIVTGIASGAYTNNDGDAATSTVLFDINAATGQLVVQIPPNSGGISPIGALGTGPTASRVGFDIYTVTGRDGESLSNLGYASLSIPDGATQLYSVDLSTGVASSIGTMFTRAQVVDIALPVGQ